MTRVSKARGQYGAGTAWGRNGVGRNGVGRNDVGAERDGAGTGWRAGFMS